MPDFGRVNLLFATLLVEELTRSGVTDFFIAPGSRSTPLVAAIASNPSAKPRIHYDERGTAFAALGYARATGRAAAWVTTSGTAVANGMPAIVEASTDCVPMILLTADRPPELRDTGANQTIRQPGIFGGYVRYELDVPPPDEATDPASLLTGLDQAIHRAHRSPAGPVHLNLMYREPLIPSPGTEPSSIPKHLQKWEKNRKPYTTYPFPENTVPDCAEVFEVLAGAERGIVVAGRLGGRREGEAAAKVAGHLGWLLFADIGSQVRLKQTVGRVDSRVTHYDLALLDGEFVRENSPDAVLRFGGASVSKRLGKFITDTRPKMHVVVQDTPFRLDPDHTVTHRVDASIVRFAEEIVEKIPESPARTAWTSGWQNASGRVAAAMSNFEKTAKAGELSEVFVARAVASSLPAGSGLVVASSMPVRDVDSYAVGEMTEHISVCINRGASGIDGTVATAAGFAVGLGAPVTVLIGDLALLHDLNSLAMIKDLAVTVVVINNDGGGIFSMLPVSEHEAFFERYFGTPHGMGFSEAAGMFGLNYMKPRTMVEFSEAYRKAASSGRSGIIEVVGSRDAAVAERRKISDIIAGNRKDSEP